MESRIKKTFAASAVQTYAINPQLVSSYTPKAGDVGIFCVLEANGEGIKDAESRHCSIFAGDLILAVFGHRYATNQIEGYVPDQPTVHCQLLSRGGVAGVVKSVNHTYKPNIIPLELVAYATDVHTGEVLNTIQWEKLRNMPLRAQPQKAKVILSVGSSMDSGKTTTAAYLCAGLQKAGSKAAYIKLTGTAFPKDAQYVYDRGATACLDFGWAGFPSTYLLDELSLLRLHSALIQEVEARVKPDYIVIEIADGILQRETAMLLQNDMFMSSVDQVILSCGDSLGVLSGLSRLQSWGITPFAISGLFTASELLVSELLPETSLPILRLQDLLSSGVEELLYEMELMQDRA